MSFGGTPEQTRQARHVYRCFSGDLCLYVGTSINVASRLEVHRAQSHWAQDVTRVKCTVHRDFTEALRVEREEIRRLRPRWNIEGRGPRATWTECDFVEVIDAMRHRRTKYSPWRRPLIDVVREQFAKRYPEIAEMALPHLQNLPEPTVVAVAA